MIGLNLKREIDQVAKDKGIDSSEITGALEEAMRQAARKRFGQDKEIEARYNDEIGEVELFEFREVVETITDRDTQILIAEAKRNYDPDVELGDEIGVKLDTTDFGRILAQAAKQVIIQRIRDAERYLIFSEYKDRKDEMVTGIVRRFERGNIIVDLGRAEAIIPIREQCPRESYRTGDRIQAYVIDVQEHARGPQIVLSRTCPQLLAKLFEIEVPEIHEGIVKIESAAREPGSRAKIAVSSSDRDVDPVGACVGMKGSRVQAVVQELRGEKIDIVPYSPDPATFVCNALQPAEVSRVLIDEGSHTMEIIVPDDQLSLAIGRKGQNVRLASQLAGWRLDIHSESRISDIKDRAWASLTKVDNCSEFLIQTLYNHGIRSAQELVDTAHEFLVQFPGIEPDNVAGMLQSAREVAKAEAEQERDLREQAEHAAQVANAARGLQAILGLDAVSRLRTVRGVGDSAFDKLSIAEFDTVEKIAECDVDELANICEFTEQKAKQLRFGANHLINEEKEIRERAEKFGIEVVDEMVKLPGWREEEAAAAAAQAAEEAAAEEAAAQAQVAAEEAALASEVEAVTDQATATELA